MGENKTEPQRGPESSNGAGLSSAELQEKTALLVHLLRNVQKPVALSGLPVDQTRLLGLLQQEPLLFHSVATIRPGQEASPAYLMGLLFHLLSISEQEVAASDPEQLLSRHLTILDKKSQSVLLLVNDADQLKADQRKQLVALSERYSAIRLVFFLAAPVAEAWLHDQFCPFSLSAPKVSSLNRSEQSNLANESRLFNVIGVVAASLLGLMMVLIFILPKGEEESVPQKMEVMPPTGPLYEGIVEERLPANEAELVVVEKVADESKDASTGNPQLPAVEEVTENVVEVKLDSSVLVEQVQDGVSKEENPVEPLSKAVEVVEEKVQVKVEVAVPLPRISSKQEASSTIHQEAWLLEQGKGKFSLQIMGGSEGASIANYIKSQKEKEQFAYYRVVKKGKDWYPLLYGLYPSKEAAKQAIKELPREYQKLNPWARSLEAIQSEIREAVSR